MSMIRKYHNHTLQAKQRHCEEDRDNITLTVTIHHLSNDSKPTSSLLTYMLRCQLYCGLTHHILLFIAIMASRFQQVLHQTRQNIHALKEETKKQEHSLRNDLFNVPLAFVLQLISVTRCLHQISHKFEIL